MPRASAKPKAAPPPSHQLDAAEAGRLKAIAHFERAGAHIAVAVADLRHWPLDRLVEALEAAFRAEQSFKEAHEAVRGMIRELGIRVPAPAPSGATIN